MTDKKLKTIGWVLTAILGALFIMSATLKLTQNETAVAQAAALGIPATTYQLIGLVEIVSFLLFIYPRTGMVGALLLIAYMGGAIATHLQHQQPVAMPIAIEILLWITAALRFPEVTHRLFRLGHHKPVA